MSLLDDLKSKHLTKDKDSLSNYNKAIRECPPVPKALLEYLDRMFSRKMIRPTSPTMEQELVYQAGIDNIIQHLRSQNDRQEQEIRQSRTKES